jgi:hypothetical protein
MKIRSLALKLLIAVAGLALLWTGLGYWVVPKLIKSQATQLVRERMHRELQLGQVQFKPWQLQLAIDDLQLPDAQGGTLIGLRHLIVDVQGWRSLRLRGAHLGTVSLDGLDVRAVIARGGALNLADLALLAGPDTGDDSPTRFAMDRLKVSDSSVSLRDEDRPKPFELQLTPVRFELHDFNTVGTGGNGFHFTAQSAAKETFDWQGKLDLEPLRSTGQISVTGLQHSTLASYLQDQLPVQLSSGTVGLQASYALRAGDGPLQLQATVQQLQVQNLALRPIGGDHDLVQLVTLTVSNAQADLVKRRVEIERIAIDGGQIDAALQANGTVNLQALAGPSAAPAADAHTAAASAGTAADPAWRAALGEFAVQGLGIGLQDQRVTPAATVQVSDLQLQVKGLNSALDHPLQVNLGAHVGDGGTLALQGQVQPKAPGFKGTLQLTQIDLTAAQPYLHGLAGLTLGSGWLDAKLDIEHTPRQPLLAQGQVDVHDLQSRDSALQEPLLNWGRLRLNGLRFTAAPQQLRIKEVVATGLFARVVVGGDRTLNVSRVIDPEGTQATANRRAPAGKASLTTTTTLPAPAPLPFDVAIDVVRIEKGASNFTDLWIKPRFTVSLMDLEGTIKGLSSKQGTRAQVDLRGNVDRYAPALINGELNLLSASAYSDMKLDFRNIELTSITPYSGYFAGYQIRKGKLAVELTYRIKDRKLDAGHHVVVDQLELGDKVDSPEATTLPVRLAIALLKDRNGVIDLNLPVTGSLDDPKFRLGPLIWKVFVNLIVKVATAPFSFIGSLFGGNDTQVNQIVFAPGSAVLSETDAQRLAALVKGMVDRPALQLEVPAANSADVDRAALLLAHADQKDATVSDAELAELGRARAAAIQDALLRDGTVEPSRVFIINGAAVATDEGSVRIDLTMK